jgi:hypothetical protein
MNPRAWDGGRRMQGVAQEVNRDQITDQIVWQRHIEGMVAAQGCVAQATGCQLEASTRLLGRPGLRIFDVRFVLVPRTTIPMYSFDTKRAMRASPLASISLLPHRQQQKH